MELRDGVEKYSSCKMYRRNYTEMSHMWLDENPNEILMNNQHLLEATKNYEIINCNAGWSYDKSMFPATVISEVCN